MIRGLFPPDTDRAKRFGNEPGLSDAEVLALPAPAIGDGDTPAPGEYTPEPLPPKVGDWCDQWARAAGQGFELHPDTEPAAIRAAQLADVRAAVAELGPAATADEVGALVVLPTWNVKRLMGEL